MIIESLTLVNFRNYSDISLDFSPHMNVFIGENAQGKTNLIEAIYVLAMARSHRASKDREMINWDKDFARIEGKIKTTRSSLPLEIILSKKGKHAKLNHLEQRRLSSYIGHLNTIIFTPEDLNIVKGSPSVRRKFIDMELGQMNAIYLHHLSQYQSILKQRNQYLKMIRYDKKKVDKIYFEILTEQLAVEGAQVLKNRFWFIENLQNWAQPIHSEISRDMETLSIEYKSSIDLTVTDDVDQIFLEIMEQFSKNREREIDQGTTVIGPHRDDISFFINGRDVQTYGSQGQQRTTALSVKLAEIDLTKELTGEYPVLLLDDVLSELDDERQTHLLQAMEKKVQTFLTTTSLEGVRQEFISEPKMFYIKNGEIETECSD